MTANTSRPFGHQTLKAVSLAALIATVGAVHAQEADEAEGADAEESVELRPVVVTGSRLSRPGTELSGNLIVLDQEAIRAMGEVTLAAVLRQLPQNINGTSEVLGSRLNGATNISGAATVNLRGIGSDSTLVLVDGRRIGYSGVLGGVTDVSTIPLNMVERIEILLDGASAVYGSEAVGGVVNIITRKDYAGLDVHVDHARPHQGGYSESTVSLSGGWAWRAGRGTIGYERFTDTGLDASRRDSIANYQRDGVNNQKNAQPGPQMRIYSWFFDDSCDADKAVVYRLDGQVLTRAQFAALSSARQRAAECHADITVPLGFMPGDDLNGIQMFGAPNWGEATEVGYSLRPERMRDSLSLGVEHALSDSLKAHGNLRLTSQETISNNGLGSISATLHANSPFNPFGRAVTVSGHIMNAKPRHFEGRLDQLFLRAGLEGEFGGWEWQADLSRSQSDLDAQRMNVLDSDTVRLGMNSDGVTEAVIGRVSGGTREDCEAARIARGGTRAVYSSFFGGNCTIYGTPPAPINPFGDLSGYVADGLSARSTNTQTQFEALLRGELFDLPGGALALVFGYDYRNDELDTMSEFHSTSTCGALSCRSVTPVGTTAFNTRISRDNHGFFVEAIAPLVGGDNTRAGVDRLALTFSARHDSYSNVEVEYRDSASGEAGTANPAEPGSATTWGLGLIWRMSDALRMKTNLQTSFKAPQLNQLIARTQARQPSPPLRGLYFTVPDSKGRTQVQGEQVLNYTGGNDQLDPETGRTLSFGVELAPDFLRGWRLNATWSDTDIKDRHAYFSSLTGIDPSNLPSNVVYIAEEDVYIRDDRWINVAELTRTGIDYELGYQGNFGEHEISVTVRHTRTHRFKVRPDPANPEEQSILTTRDDVNNDLRATLPPVPEYQTNTQLTWARAGLTASLDIHDAARTNRIAPGGEKGLKFITEPATVTDLVVSYDFGQGTVFDALWAQDMSATLTVNNLLDRFSANSQENIATGAKRSHQFNPIYELTQGRSYRLALRKMF